MKKYYDLKFLPIHITKEKLNLVKEIVNTKNKLKIERIRTLDTSHKKNKNLSLVKCDKFKYITYHTKTKTYYSDIKQDIYDKPKILLNMSGHINIELIKDGNITESKFFILPNKKESEFILQLFYDNKIIEYLELCKYSGFNSRIILDNVGYN